MNLKFIIFLTLAFTLSAQINTAYAEAKIHTTISSQSFYVGQEFTYEVLISGAKKVTVADPEESDDLRVKFIEKIVMDASEPSGVALRYRMMPMTPGMVHIPAFHINADDAEFMTDEEVFIKVDVPESYPGLAITRRFPSRDFYVGEPFQVDYVWKSPLPLSGYRAIQLNLPLFYSSEFRSRSLHNWIAGNNKAAIGLPVSNTRLIARYGHLEVAGEFYSTVSFSKIMMPAKAGEITIRPATLLASYIPPPKSQQRQRGWRTNYPSYFNNNFFEDIDGEAFKKYYVASPPQTLHVLPLPDAGKPHDFAGQVGKRKITVTASPKIVAAGDPITLTIVVDGCEFLETVVMPELDQQVAFTRQFALPVKASRGRIDAKKKTYIRTLRPLAQDVTAIPAVRFPYFDPATKSYAVAESAPIPITVNAAETVTAFDAEVSGAGPLRNLLLENHDGIRANFTEMQASHSGDSLGFHGPTKIQWLLILLVVPPLTLVLVLLVTAKSRLMKNDPVRAKSNRALPTFRKSIELLGKSASSSDQEAVIGKLDNIVRCYFADRYNLVRHAHTVDELESVLRKSDKSSSVGGGGLDQLREIYAACEQKKYSPTSDPVDAVTLVQLAKQFILTLDKKS